MSFLTDYSANLPATGNVNFSGNSVTLGSNANLHISGGTSNQALTTDGLGNLSWTTLNANQQGVSTQLGFTFTGHTANGTGTTGAQSEIVDYTFTNPYTPNAGALVWNGFSTTVTSLPTTARIKYLNGQYVAAAGLTKGTMTIYTSTDGFIWTTNTSIQGAAAFGATTSILSIGYGKVPSSIGGGDGWMVIVMDTTNWKLWAAYSKDLSTWGTSNIQNQPGPSTPSTLSNGGDITYDTGSSSWFVAYCSGSTSSGTIFIGKSADGVTWTMNTGTYTNVSNPAPTVQIAISPSGTILVSGYNSATLIKCTTTNIAPSVTPPNSFCGNTTSVNYLNGYFVVTGQTFPYASYSADGSTFTAVANSVVTNYPTGSAWLPVANVWVFNGYGGVYTSPPFANGAPGNGTASLVTSTSYGGTPTIATTVGNAFFTGGTSDGFLQWQYIQTQTRYTIGLPATSVNGQLYPQQTLTFTPNLSGTLTSWVTDLQSQLQAARPSYSFSSPSTGVLRMNSNANVDFGAYGNANLVQYGTPPTTGNFSANAYQVGSSGITGVRDTVVFTNPQTGASWSFQPSFNDTLQTVANVSAIYNTLTGWTASIPGNIVLNPNLTYYTSSTIGAINPSYYVTASVLRGSNSTLTINGANAGGITGTYSNSVGNTITTGISPVNSIVNGTSNVIIPTANGNINAGGNGIVALVIGSNGVAGGGYAQLNVSNISLGYQAGAASQGANAVAIGQNAGRVSQGASAVAIGANSGSSSQGANSLAIGSFAANGGSSANAIAIGLQAAAGNAAGIGAVAIGPFAGYGTNATFFQSTGAIAIGSNAGYVGQGAASIAIGVGAALGNAAGASMQGANSVAVGAGAGGGGVAQAANTTAIGYQAGYTSQGVGAVAVGLQAGYSSQGANAIAIGNTAGNSSQGANSIAIGFNAGFSSLAANAIAIGQNAGYANTTANSIYIGAGAGANGGSFANVIVLNSTGANFNPAAGNGLYVSTVRSNGSGSWSTPAAGIPSGFYPMAYNAATGEIIIIK